MQGILTEVEIEGVVTYGRGIGGVFVDHNANAVIRFTVKHPGWYECKCSIHPKTGRAVATHIQAVEIFSAAQWSDIALSTIMLNAESEIGPLVLGLTPSYLDASCHEALHEVDLGTLKSEFRSTEEHEYLRGSD